MRAAAETILVSVTFAIFLRIGRRRLGRHRERFFIFRCGSARSQEANDIFSYRLITMVLRNRNIEAGVAQKQHDDSLEETTFGSFAGIPT